MYRFTFVIATVVSILAGCGAAAPAATPTPTAPPTASPSATSTAPPPSPVLIARGTFENKGATVELDATGSGSSVQGHMTMSASDFSFTVDLECTRTLPSGLILIGGDVRDSTLVDTPNGTRAAIVLKRGSPVQAHPDFEYPDPPEDTCMAYLAEIDEARAADHLDPITVGTIELGP